MTAARPILPHDRPMTAAETRGFRIACACFATWGRMIEVEGFRLGGPPVELPRVRLMQHSGRMIVGVAEALDRTLGRAPDAEQLSRSGPVRSSSPP